MTPVSQMSVYPRRLVSVLCRDDFSSVSVVLLMTCAARGDSRQWCELFCCSAHCSSKQNLKQNKKYTYTVCMYIYIFHHHIFTQTPQDLGRFLTGHPSHSTYAYIPRTETLPAHSGEKHLHLNTSIDRECTHGISQKS